MVRVSPIFFRATFRQWLWQQPTPSFEGQRFKFRWGEGIKESTWMPILWSEHLMERWRSSPGKPWLEGRDTGDMSGLGFYGFFHMFSIYMFSIYFICFRCVFDIFLLYVFLDSHSINTLRDHSFGSFVCRLDGVMRENGYLPGWKDKRLFGVLDETDRWGEGFEPFIRDLKIWKNPACIQTEASDVDWEVTEDMKWPGNWMWLWEAIVGSIESIKVQKSKTAHEQTSQKSDLFRIAAWGVSIVACFRCDPSVDMTWW